MGVISATITWNRIIEFKTCIIFTSSYSRALSCHLEAVLIKDFTTGSAWKSEKYLHFQPIIFNTSKEYQCSKCKPRLTDIKFTAWGKFKTSFRVRPSTFQVFMWQYNRFAFSRLVLIWKIIFYDSLWYSWTYV